MTSDFIPVLILMLLAGTIATVIPILSSFLGRQRPDDVKSAPYECGVAEIEPLEKRTSIRYYMTALMFIVFDIEIAFLYPWAVAVKRMDAPGLKIFMFVEMMLFLGVLLLAYAWVWKKGVLDWD